MSELPEDLMGRTLREGSLLLRPLVARDAGEIFLLTDTYRSELRTYMTWVDATTAVADVSFYILGLDGFWKTGMTYGVFEGETLMGTVGFHHSEMRNNRSEIGYWLGPPFQGRGLGKKAVALAIEAAFRYTSLYRLEAKIQEANAASVSLVQRLGFKYEGVERAGVRFGQEYIDHGIYSLLRPDWEARE